MATTLVFGRDPGCDVTLDHPTVSARHARLVLTRSGIVLEDLGSTNGTYVDDARIDRVAVERGTNVRLGDVILPWSDPRIVAFTRKVSARGTLVMSAAAAAARPRPDRATDARPRSSWPIALAALLAVIGGGVVLAWFVVTDRGASGIARTFGTDAGTPVDDDPSIEGVIRRERAPGIVAAIDANDPTTRNTAVKLAAGEEGPFHVEQIARIWTHVRGRWRYVKDPRGAEYFAKASETITNEYAGDCDDFATVLAAMITAIGGEARVVVMDGTGGAHAYAEACIRMDATEIATRLGRYYRNKWDPYLGRQRIERIHFRSNESCPVWLNLDSSAGVPGGPYVDEEWAISVSTSGDTDALAPGRADARPDAGAASRR